VLVFFVFIILGLKAVVFLVICGVFVNNKASTVTPIFQVLLAHHFEDGQKTISVGCIHTCIYV